MTANDLFVDSGDGTRIAARDHGGEGPPLVLVHGPLGNLASFDDVAPRLTASYRVVAYDQRGHGWSESGPTTAATYVADLAAVVTALGLERPVLWGQSFGSIVAAAAISAGIEVRALVNEDGFIVDGVPPGDDELTEGRRVFPAGSLDAVLEGWSSAAAGMPAGIATGERSILRHADGRIELRPTQTELTDKVRTMWSTPIAATYRALTAPVLLLAAREGGLAASGHRERDVDELTRTAGGPVTVHWFDTDHWISALDPEGVAAALRRFASDL